MKLIAEITDKEILGKEGLSIAKPRYTARAIVKNGDLYAVISSEKFHPYSLPGGGIDDGEDIITALKREILEETGCTCKSISELGIVKENRASTDYTQCSYYYVVEVDSIGIPNFTEEEINSGTALQWNTLPETIRLINDIQPATYQQQYLKARDIAALTEYIELSQLKWIFFDLGSTLIDETDCYQNRIDEIVKINSINRDEFVCCVKNCAKENAFAIKTAAKKYGVNVPHWRCEYEKLYPCTKALLERLSQNYHLGIIANQKMGTEGRLEKWKIKDYFDVIISSTELGVSKPNLQIFEIAMKKAGCQPNNAIMVGDRIDNDILPAKLLGMKTVWVKQAFAEYQPDSVIPDYTINSIEELESVL